MATACKKEAEAKKWSEAASALGSFHTKPDGTLLVDAVNELPYSHRHLSHVIGLYPFNLPKLKNTKLHQG